MFRLFFYFFLVSTFFVADVKGEIFSKEEEEFSIFLKNFIPHISHKEKQLCQAIWILETTGVKDAADLVSSLECEYNQLLSNNCQYEQLSKLKICLHTSLSGGSMNIKGKNVGANYFLTKFDADKLLEITHKAITEDS